MTNLNDIKLGVLTPNGVQELSAVTLKEISDNDYKQVLDAGNVGECRLMVEIINLEEYGCDSEYKYQCTIYATKQKHRMTKKQKADITSSCGIEWKQINYVDILDYGLSAPLEGISANENDFTAWINETLPRVKMLFGFYMDRPVNRIGNDGWGFINGHIGWNKRK